MKKREKGKKKICFAASSGGHFEQLMMLKPLMDQYDSFILTEKTSYSVNTKGTKTYFLRQVNRKEKTALISLLINTVISIKIFIDERPDAIICTGVLAMLPMCLICKLFKKKVIYIESFAKVTSATQSGKLMYKYADQFYIQWESMKEIYPNALYLGGIY